MARPPPTTGGSGILSTVNAAGGRRELWLGLYWGFVPNFAVAALAGTSTKVDPATTPSSAGPGVIASESDGVGTRESATGGPGSL